MQQTDQHFPYPRRIFAMTTPSNDILSWTNQDARESVLFNAWGILYRFQVCSFSRSSGIRQGFLPCIPDRRQPQQQPERYDALAHYPPQQGGPSGQTRVGG